MSALEGWNGRVDLPEDASTRRWHQWVRALTPQAAPGVALLGAGERSSSPNSLSSQRDCSNGGVLTHLCESCALVACVFLRLGVGMRHSMEKAVQLVQGTPRLAASQRTCDGQFASRLLAMCRLLLTLRAWQAARC